jgi:hypothetical protein
MFAVRGTIGKISRRGAPAMYSGIGGPGTLATYAFMNRWRGMRRRKTRCRSTVRNMLPAGGRLFFFCVRLCLRRSSPAAGCRRVLRWGEARASRRRRCHAPPRAVLGGARPGRRRRTTSSLHASGFHLLCRNQEDHDCHASSVLPPRVQPRHVAL